MSPAYYTKLVDVFQAAIELHLRLCETFTFAELEKMRLFGADQKLLLALNKASHLDESICEKTSSMLLSDVYP